MSLSLDPLVSMLYVVKPNIIFHNVDNKAVNSYKKISSNVKSQVTFCHLDQKKLNGVNRSLIWDIPR